MGCIAEIVGIIALFILWNNPEFSNTWWIIIGLVIGNWLFNKVIQESIKMYGMKSKVSIFYSLILSVIQLFIIGMSCYYIWLDFK